MQNTSTPSSEKFTAPQRRVFLGCILVYAGAYIARLNLAAALPALVSAFSISEAQGGLIQTVFALVYAAGQLINGAIVDRISAKRYIIAGLIASMVCNLLFGLATAYWQLLVLWALNGVAQSMLWTPVVKLLAIWFSPRQRSRATLWISIALIGGHLAAWAIAGYMAQLLGWQLSFIIPAATLLVFIALAFWLLDDTPAASEAEQAPQGGASVTPAAMPIGDMIFKTGLWLVLLCCIANGFVRDGVMTWSPSILGSMRDAGAAISPTAISLVIPLVNMCGIGIGQFLISRARRGARAITGGMMLAGALVSGLLALLSGSGLVGYALMLGACCALMSGMNPMLTMLMPMEYAPYGRVGLAAGIIDSFIYLGSALVSVTAGYMKDLYGWPVVFVSWAVVAALGAVAVVLSIPMARRGLGEGVR